VLTNTSNSTVVVEVTTRLGRVLLNRPAPARPATPAPAPAPPPPPPPPPPAPDVLRGFAGTWQGTLVHFEGDIALRFTVSDKGDIEASFAGRPAQKLTNATLRGNSLRGQVDALLATTPGYHGIPSLSFRLERTNDRLAGICTVSVPNVVILSHWVSLERQPGPGAAAPNPSSPRRPAPVLAKAHSGWLQKRCEPCHGVPVAQHGPSTDATSCTTCHGGNGACDPLAPGGKTEHKKDSDCASCHKTRHGYSKTPECTACHMAAAGLRACRSAQ
jgi:hypothetical protein